jgi:hypothetical protein
MLIDDDSCSLGPHIDKSIHSPSITPLHPVTCPTQIKPNPTQPNPTKPNQTNQPQELTQDKVKFGERVDAPLQVQLKRKHWIKGGGQSDEQSGGQSGGGGNADDTAKARCTRIFAAQMATAQQRMQGLQQGQQARKKQKQQHAPVSWCSKKACWMFWGMFVDCNLRHHLGFLCAAASSRALTRILTVNFPPVNFTPRSTMDSGRP